MKRYLAIKNVTFSNIIVHGHRGVRIEGFDGSIDNIQFKEFQLFMEPENAVGKRARNASLFDKVSDLSLTDCDVVWNEANPEPTWECVYKFVDVDGIRMRDVRGNAAPGSTHEAIEFIHTSNIDSR